MLLARFGGAWPEVRVTADVAETWFEAALAPVDVELGAEVVRRILAEDKRFPAPARFNEVLRAVRRGQERPFAALETGSPLPRDEQLAHVAKAREPLRDAPPPGVPPDLAARVAVKVAEQSACEHDYRFHHDNHGRPVDRCERCGHWREGERPAAARINPAGAVADR